MTESTITLGRFFEQAREGALTAIRCGGCGALAVPPKELCPECGARRWEPVPLSGEGTLQLAGAQTKNESAAEVATLLQTEQ